MLTKIVQVYSGRCSITEISVTSDWNVFRFCKEIEFTTAYAIKKGNKLAATLRDSRPGVQSASLIMTSLMTS